MDNIEDMGNIVVKKLITSVVPECFWSNHLECRHFRIRCLHALKDILAKCVVIPTLTLKFNNETLRILFLKITHL